MSRQYSNRPLIPPRRRVALQMCDFVSYPPPQTNDTSSDSTPWQLTDPLSCIHQQPTSIAPPPITAQNDFSYFQYPPYRQTFEPPLPASNREINNNQHVHQLNEVHPSCHFHYLEPNPEEPPRPLLPLSVVTVKKKILFFIFFVIYLF
jgi:hypothetical protein